MVTDKETKSIRTRPDVEVLSEGDYKVETYYICPPKDTGAAVQLSFNSNSITIIVTEPNDPPVRGRDFDLQVSV